MHFHSPAVGSERFIGFLLSVSFHFSGTWESLQAVIATGSIFNRGWLKWGLREKRVQKTPPPACIAIKSLLLELGGRVCACTCFS